MGRLLLSAPLLCLATATFLGRDGAPGFAPAGNYGAPSGSCTRCHAGIEEMHPGYPLSCVDCHGGDGSANDKQRAHVQPRKTPPGDERVLPRNHDLPWQRFRNPSNLRVAHMVCGDCHDPTTTDVLKSLHATTCGHLGDGFYEHGLQRSKRPSFGVFAQSDDDGDVPAGALRSVRQVPAPKSGGPRDRIENHYADLPRKACMRLPRRGLRRLSRHVRR